MWPGLFKSKVLESNNINRPIILKSYRGKLKLCCVATMIYGSEGICLPNSSHISDIKSNGPSNIVSMLSNKFKDLADTHVLSIVPDSDAIDWHSDSSSTSAITHFHIIIPKNAGTPQTELKDVEQCHGDGVAFDISLVHKAPTYDSLPREAYGIRISTPIQYSNHVENVLSMFFNANAIMSNTEKTRREQRELTANRISDFKQELQKKYAVDIEMGRSRSDDISRIHLDGDLYSIFENNNKELFIKHSNNIKGIFQMFLDNNLAFENLSLNENKFIFSHIGTLNERSKKQIQDWSELLTNGFPN